MIQEILAIAQDFKRYGIVCSELWHPHLPKCPKGRAYKVILNKNGSLRVIEPFDDKTWSGLRYYYPCNQRQFPSFKIASCLSQETYNNAVRDANSMSDAKKNIKENLDSGKASEFAKAFKKFENCLYKCNQELISQLDQNNSVFNALFDLSGAIEKSNAKDLYFSIVDYLLLNKEEASLVKSFHLGFDIYQEKFDGNYVPVQHPKTFEEINRSLLKSQRDVQDDGNLDYLGNSSFGYKKTFRMTIGHIGNIGLFDRNENSPMLERYGVNGKDSFIIGNKSREYLMAPLQFLTHESRYNKTYKNLGKSRGKTVLALCYWDGIDQFDTMAPLFCTAEEDKDGNLIADFEKESEDILKVFSEVVQKIPDAKFKVICIKVPTTGPSYVSYSKQLMLSRLVDATREWIDGCKIFLNLSNKFNRIFLPSPMDFWKIINKKIGLGKNGEYGISNYDYFSINEIYEFFLGDNSSVRKIASVLANNHAKMLVYQKEKKTNYEINIKTIPFILPMMGLVINRINKEKEKHMNELGSLFGEYCSVANEIQKLYFESRRPSKHDGSKCKGRIPSRLLGSEHIQWFMIDPCKALSSLGQKLIVYRDWAQANMKTVPYAGYCVAKLREINEKIMGHSEELSKFRFTEIDKIYLSASYHVGLTKLDKNINTKEEIIEENPVDQ